MKKPSNTAKILGLQGVKVVSAEGIESARKRKFNNMQGHGWQESTCKALFKHANGSQTDRTFHPLWLGDSCRGLAF